MADFESTWQDSAGFTDKLKENLAPEKDLKVKVQKSIRALDRQQRKIKRHLNKLTKKDKKYYNKILETLRRSDKERATFYANELAEVRKGIRSIEKAQMALEQISLRLSTVEDIGDLAATLGPAMSVLQSVGGSLSTVMPQADREFNAISDMMNEVIADAGQVGGVDVDFSTANEEAERILADAEAQVEDEMQDRLPEVPQSSEEAQDIQL